MDFSDDQHSLAELVFQGATELDLDDSVSAAAREALAAWRGRSKSHEPCTDLLQFPDCSVFSITYQGEAGDYWPDAAENAVTETLIRDFLYHGGICSLSDDHIRHICMKYQVMAVDGDEHVLVCPYLTEAGNISGIVVVCVTKMVHATLY